MDCVAEWFKVGTKVSLKMVSRGFESRHDPLINRPIAYQVKSTRLITGRYRFKSDWAYQLTPEPAMRSDCVGC